MNQYCFLNGKIVPMEEAKVSVLDIGLLRGYGVYEGIAGINGKPFHFASHWNRFLSGAHILNLNVPVTEETAEKTIIELIEKNNLKTRCNIRMILTGGETLGGIDYDFEKPTFCIIVEKWEPLPNEIYENGGKIITYRHLRELPEYKTTNYIRAVNLQNFRKEERAVEVLYIYDGEVLECATSNIFIVKDRKLITPVENILKGITRQIIIGEISKNYEVEERVVTEEELKTADEVFITSSFKDIVPVVKIDDFEVGSGEVGSVTKDMMTKFKAYISVQ